MDELHPRGVAVALGQGTLGVAVGEAFARGGDRVAFLCGVQAEDETREFVNRGFEKAGLAPPVLVAADLSRPRAADALDAKAYTRGNPAHGGFSSRGVEYWTDGDDARIPECVDRLITNGGNVMSQRLAESGAYFGAIQGALDRPSTNNGQITQHRGRGGPRAHRSADVGAPGRLDQPEGPVLRHLRAVSGSHRSA